MSIYDFKWSRITKLCCNRAAWELIAKWVEENELKIDMRRPSYEIYKNNPQEHPQGHHLLDVCMSVE